MDFKTQVTGSAGLPGTAADALLVVLAGTTVPDSLDEPLAAALKAAVADGDFSFKAGSSLLLHKAAGVKAPRLLFVAGGALVYQYVLPTFMDLSFSQEFTAAGAKVVYLPKVKEYYELTISLLAAFGFAFQLPIVMSLLARAGVVNAGGLRKGRKFALVVIVFAAMFMTPPDPFSWVLLSVPLFLLYESGIIAAMLIDRARKRREAADAKREEEEARREAAEEESRRRAAAAAQSARQGALPAGE